MTEKQNYSDLLFRQKMNKNCFFVAQLGDFNTILRTSAMPGAKPMATKWLKEIIRTHFPHLHTKELGEWKKLGQDGACREVQELGSLSIQPFPIYAMKPDGSTFRIQSIFF